MPADAKPTFVQGGTPEGDALRAVACRKMAERLSSGGRIVIGTNQAVEVGFTVAVAGEQLLVIKRRATRQDFIDAAPVAGIEDAGIVAAMRMPFYYELELRRPS